MVGRFTRGLVHRDPLAAILVALCAAHRRWRGNRVASPRVRAIDGRHAAAAGYVTAAQFAERGDDERLRQPRPAIGRLKLRRRDREVALSIRGLWRSLASASQPAMQAPLTSQVSRVPRIRRCVRHSGGHERSATAPPGIHAAPIRGERDTSSHAPM